MRLLLGAFPGYSLRDLRHRLTPTRGAQEVDAADFTACAAPANGKATCTTTDPDFLGAAYDHAVQVECGIVCNEVSCPLPSRELSIEDRD